MKIGRGLKAGFCAVVAVAALGCSTGPSVVDGGTGEAGAGGPDAGVAREGGAGPREGGIANRCGSFYTAGFFACYQSQCAAEFVQCFGPDSLAGAVTGTCRTYGECICTCTSEQDCQRCALDQPCQTCNTQSGLEACALARCADAGG